MSARESTRALAAAGKVDSVRVSAAIDAFNQRWEIAIHRIMAGLILAAAGMIVAISPSIGLELAVPELGG